jgi:hypothetical protein
MEAGLPRLGDNRGVLLFHLPPHFPRDLTGSTAFSAGCHAGSKRPSSCATSVLRGLAWANNAIGASARPSEYLRACHPAAVPATSMGGGRVFSLKANENTVG